MFCQANLKLTLLCNKSFVNIGKMRGKNYFLIHSFLPLKFSAFLTTKMAEIGITDLWIGLNSLKQDGFYWTDGKKRQYTNWGYSVSTHDRLAWC